MLSSFDYGSMLFVLATVIGLLNERFIRIRGRSRCSSARWPSRWG
jgi:hypothetical protein